MFFTNYEALTQKIMRRYFQNTKKSIDVDNKQYLWNMERNNIDLFAHGNYQYLWNTSKNGDLMFGLS